MATQGDSVSEPVPETQTTVNNIDLEPAPKPKVVYRCKKCRRIVASDETIIPHEPGSKDSFVRWKKKSDYSGEKTTVECSSIFVEPMKWMQTVQEGFLLQKLQCMGCNARLGSFNWAGMQCNCGAWVNPAFLLHKSKLDECRI